MITFDELTIYWHEQKHTTTAVCTGWCSELTGNYIAFLFGAIYVSVFIPSPPLPPLSLLGPDEAHAELAISCRMICVGLSSIHEVSSNGIHFTIKLTELNRISVSLDSLRSEHSLSIPWSITMNIIFAVLAPSALTELRISCFHVSINCVFSAAVYLHGGIVQKG